MPDSLAAKDPTCVQWDPACAHWDPTCVQWDPTCVVGHRDVSLQYRESQMITTRVCVTPLFVEK